MESKELWDGFYGILMGCKEFFGVLVEFSWEFNGIFMLDVGCWMLMHFFIVDVVGLYFLGSNRNSVGDLRESRSSSVDEGNS